MVESPDLDQGPHCERSVDFSQPAALRHQLQLPSHHRLVIIGLVGFVRFIDEVVLMVVTAAMVPLFPAVHGLAVHLYIESRASACRKKGHVGGL